MNRVSPRPTGCGGRSRVFVWDLPVRIFHWALPVLLAGLYLTAVVLDDTMELHARLGLGVLVLVLFRVLWGLFGSTYARFGAFLRGPRTVLGYLGLSGERSHPPPVGHNPLGGWMVAVLLLGLLAQAVLGLCGNDDVLFEGSLARYLSKDTSDFLTGLHTKLFYVLLGLVAVHVAAVIWHRVVKDEDLVTPMITGHRELPAGLGAPDASGGGLGRAAVLFGICAGLVYWLAA